MHIKFAQEVFISLNIVNNDYGTHMFRRQKICTLLEQWRGHFEIICLSLSSYSGREKVDLIGSLRKANKLMTKPGKLANVEHSLVEKLFLQVLSSLNLNKKLRCQILPKYTGFIEVYKSIIILSVCMHQREESS